MRILLVEDEVELQRLLKKALIDAGYVVDVAADLTQARALVEGAKYDLAIVDFFLGDETGDEFIAELRSQVAVSELPIVAISVADAEAREKSLAAGADFFMEKPLVHRDLFSTLERLLSWGRTA